MFRIFC